MSHIWEPVHRKSRWYRCSLCEGMFWSDSGIPDENQKLPSYDALDPITCEELVAKRVHDS